MKYFSISIGTLIMRYYLLMAVIIVALLIGLPFLAFLALPIFLSALMGVSFKGMFQFNKNKKPKTIAYPNMIHNDIDRVMA